LILLKQPFHEQIVSTYTYICYNILLNVY
jgi:hypothetical protein